MKLEVIMAFLIAIGMCIGLALGPAPSKGCHSGSVEALFPNC